MSAILDRRARQHFDELSDEEKRQAIYNLADFGHGEYTIASASGISIEAVRQVLAERSDDVEAL